MFTPPTSISVKSSSGTTSRTSSPIPSGVPLPSLPGLDDIDDIPEFPSGQSYTTIHPLSPTSLSSKSVVIITSSPTYTVIALSNNEQKSKRLTSDIMIGVTILVHQRYVAKGRCKVSGRCTTESHWYITRSNKSMESYKWGKSTISCASPVHL